MTKKNPFDGLMQKRKAVSEERTAQPRLMGAGKSITGSINLLAQQAEQLAMGDTIIELSTDIVDPSFVADRIDDGSDFDEFVQTIANEGQQQPILVRPNPKDQSRYMIVFGHRRWAAAKRLQKTVRAVVRELTDVEHVVLQGRENSARANLSFLEKAMFAKRLADDGYENQTLLAALTCDASALSKLLSVAQIPPEVVAHLGAARKVGREPLYQLKKLLDRPGNKEAALTFLETQEATSLAPSDKVVQLLSKLKQTRKKRPAKAKPEKWISNDSRIKAETIKTARNYSISLSGGAGVDPSAFGQFIADQLPDIYESYLNNADKENER
ncbi:plasmid partitioning protein RepB [Roseibium sp. RKSG952]|uniref:plasmid partitioning protein RepB n=1 Tax=Roseibium sp. RKSG952 TaxID=2529384 RepID=UPI0012BC5123|nr:plasmid partitioning protein RepB [Roseibium sp. RKSG952]MTH95040.1 plasmid partitioning protein RepB [Roseibium sp. RKSG952]